MSAPRITISIVSHRQNALVNALLGDLARHCAADIPIVLTENVPDETAFATAPVADRVRVISNPQPRGFGANHNAAFAHCRTPFYCVANPDIRLESDPFAGLAGALEDERVGVVGPRVRSPAGKTEDSARRFPTPWSLLRRRLVAPSGPDYPTDRGPVKVDWVAGMFMLFRSDDFRSIGGFDEAYFLYFEDTEICRRLLGSGKAALYEPRTEVVHDARRASRRNPGLALHHLRSALRFLSRV